MMVSAGTIAHDHYLVPDDLYLKQGEYLKGHLLLGDDLVKEFEQNYQPAKTVKFTLTDNIKNAGLTKVAKDGD